MEEIIICIAIIGMFCILLGVSCMQNPYLKHPEMLQGILMGAGIILLAIGAFIVIFGGIDGY